MKTLSILLLAGTCSQVIDIEGCGKREVKYPCPEISPTPEITPSPVTSPIPGPSPSPVSSPSPEISPIPSPVASPSPMASPIIPSPNPSPSSSPVPWKCTVDFQNKNNCQCCDINLAFAQERGYWSCPDSYPGNSSEPYDPKLGGGLCHNNGDVKFRIDRECNKWSVLANGNFLVAKRESGWDHLYCEDVIKPSPSASPISSPTPETSPTPQPPTGGLTPAGNYPLPMNWQDNHTCNADYAKGTPTSLGAAYLSTVPIKPGTRYIGIRINVSATPHVAKPYCEQSCYDEEGTYALSNCRNTCEQLKGCQDQDGTPIYMTLPGKFENEICDEQSGNKWNCHHKPEIGQTGPTTFIPYPRGVSPGSEEAKKFCGGPHPKRPGFINCAGITVEVK